ncbi:3-phosphoshikimate 1-carboxyvinyltransferase [Candidatus Pelagibacter sp.]|nr:3-phosphoshikimate 1-carboxyvinyltransferase [Candidatus Pelagibacter sp.]
MNKVICIKNKIKDFNKTITVDGDKSLSIRWALLASQAKGKSKAYNLLMSEDVLFTLKCLKKLGIKVNLNKKYCEIIGKGINKFDYKKNLILNAGNSGTLGRLILALLIRSPFKIKLIGDRSLSKRDFSRVTKPLKKFGAHFYPKNKNTLPIYIKGGQSIKPIKYYEKKGSAQIKSCIMLAALNSPGTTKIIALRSRNHTEILFKYLKIPIKLKIKKKLTLIEIKKKNQISSFNYNIPSDISSSAFFLVLTILSKNSKLTIKNVNINPTRTGCISILNKMGAKIIFKNIKYYKGEKIADISVKSIKNLKAIKCPVKYNSSAIDEFLIIFLVAARSKGVSFFKNLSELNQKESPRLKLGSKILNVMGIKTELTNHSIKIFGNPDLQLNKAYKIKNYLKDHRIFMMTTIAGLAFGGSWKINDADSINTSFPNFLKVIKNLGGKIN